MAAGKINLQKASGDVTVITCVDGTGNTEVVLPESGTVATTASVKAEISNGSNLVTSPTGALGYGTGAGGTVTQLTSKSTAVTLNKLTGQITMHNASLAAGAAVSFVLYSSLITAQSSVKINVVLNSVAYFAEARSVQYGYALIYVKNETGSALAESVPLFFSVIKGTIA